MSLGGSNTVSITWITPFEATMSAAMIFAFPTVRPIGADLPFTVLALEVDNKSVDMILPATTW